MAKKTSTGLTPQGRSKSPLAEYISPEQHENMVREAAYFRYVQRDAVPGHELDDWLAAEAELFGGESEPQSFEARETADFGGQESGVHGFWEEDALKRIIKQHPQKGIPQVESMEPREAPPRE